MPFQHGCNVLAQLLLALTVSQMTDRFLQNFDGVGFLGFFLLAAIHNGCCSSGDKEQKKNMQVTYERNKRQCCLYFSTKAGNFVVYI